MAQKIPYGQPPRVDLLPVAQRAELRHERTLPFLLLAILVSAFVAALIWAAGILPVQAADERLRAAEAESTEILTSISQYSEEQQALNSLNKLSTARTDLTATEVLFAEVYDEVIDALPDGVTIDSFSAQPGAPGFSAGQSSAVDLNPLCIAYGATVTLEFTGPGLAEVVEFSNNLEGLTGFTCVVSRLITDDPDADTKSVTMQIALDESVLAARFAEVAE